MKYHFENLDMTTRICMSGELYMDLKSGNFYEPTSMTSYGLSRYPDLLKECFLNGNVASLTESLTKDFFKSFDSRGRQIRFDMNEIVAFNDFNRYYIRALLARANDETIILQVYRTKESKIERNESKSIVGKIYSNREEILYMLELFRDWKRLFSVGHDLLKPNSGLSLRLHQVS